MQTISSLILEQAVNRHYAARYVKFIAACATSQQTGYTEQHHILPKCYWPEYASLRNHPWNRAVLTARQHYIAHLMLAKAFGGKMWFALNAMVNLRSTTQDRTHNVSSRVYALLKLNVAERMSATNKGLVRSDEHRRKLSVSNAGKKRTPEFCQNLSAKLSGVPKTDEHKAKLRIAALNRDPALNQILGDLRRGKPLSDEQKAKMSATTKGLVKNEDHKAKISKGQCKNWYEILCPDQTIVVVDNLHQFSKANKLDSSDFKRKGVYKGFTLLSTTPKA